MVPVYLKWLHIALSILTWAGVQIVNAKSDILKMDLRINASTLLGRIIYQDGSFNNIPGLITRMESTANFSEGSYTTLCARGVWLFYDGPIYTLSDPDMLNGLSLYASDSFKCTSLDEIGELGSVRSLTWPTFKNPNIAIFESRSFLGYRWMPKRKANTPITMDSPEVPVVVGSIVTVGKYRWTIVLEDGTKVCIQPKKSESSVCLLSNFADKKNFAEGTRLKMARKHCLKNVTKLVELTECYDIGLGLIRPINPAWPFGAPDNETATNETGSGECKVDDSGDILTPEQKELIQKRINGSLGSTDWMSQIKNPQNIWKTELFDKVLDIFMEICDERIIDPEFVLIFSSLFFHHLDKGWGNGSDVDFPEEVWREIMYDIDLCSQAAPAFGPSMTTESDLVILETYKSLKDLTDPAEEVLGSRPNYDVIMELHWVMANVVAKSCHVYTGADANFALKFWDIYHLLYFAPILEQWKNPSNVTTAYKYIFGGFGMEKSFAKLFYCGALVIRDTPLEIYKRPVEQTNKLLLPRVTVAGGNPSRGVNNMVSET